MAVEVDLGGATIVCRSGTVECAVDVRDLQRSTAIRRRRTAFDRGLEARARLARGYPLSRGWKPPERASPAPRGRVGHPPAGRHVAYTGHEAIRSRDPTIAGTSWPRRYICQFGPADGTFGPPPRVGEDRIEFGRSLPVEGVVIGPEAPPRGAGRPGFMPTTMAGADRPATASRAGAVSLRHAWIGGRQDHHCGPRHRVQPARAWHRTAAHGDHCRHSPGDRSIHGVGAHDDMWISAPTPSGIVTISSPSQVTASQGPTGADKTTIDVEARNKS